MSIQDDLKHFYTTEAKKYAQTREKKRSDAAFFLDVLKNSEQKNIKILEFGCWSGRFLSHLVWLQDKKIEYIWVDLSSGLLNIAKKHIRPSMKQIKATFICDDILNVVQHYTQESFDYIIGIASFQHIPSKKERFYLMKNFYRLLCYDGKVMMTNRSFSRRFCQKYKSAIFHAIIRYLFSWGKRERNSFLIPRKSQKKQFLRFYHIFTPKEIENLAHLSWFHIDTISYLDKKGQPTPRWKDANNTLLVCSKTIFG